MVQITAHNFLDYYTIWDSKQVLKITFFMSMTTYRYLLCLHLVAPEAPGLYFVGLHFPYGLTSTLHGGVGYIAQSILGQICHGVTSSKGNLVDNKQAYHSAVIDH